MYYDKQIEILKKIDKQIKKEIDDGIIAMQRGEFTREIGEINE